MHVNFIYYFIYFLPYEKLRKKGRTLRKRKLNV